MLCDKTRQSKRQSIPSSTCTYSSIHMLLPEDCNDSFGMLEQQPRCDLKLQGTAPIGVWHVMQPPSCSMAGAPKC
jgi:hypothetical protein